MVVLDTEVLIWSVEIVIREPEADQEALRSESFLEGVDHWNGASLANKDRLTSEACLEGLLRRLDRLLGRVRGDGQRGARRVRDEQALITGRCGSGTIPATSTTRFGGTTISLAACTTRLPANP